MSSKHRGWIGVDLDGTLAMYEGYKGLNEIGEPIESMVERVQKWLEEGREVRIMTARVAQSIWRPRHEDVFRTVYAIEDWCLKHIGQRLKVTCIKDFEMTELWDDRAVQLVPNTGLRVDALRDYPDLAWSWAAGKDLTEDQRNAVYAFSESLTRWHGPKPAL